MGDVWAISIRFVLSEAMSADSPRPPLHRGRLLLVGAAVLLLLAAPVLAAGGLGRFVGGLWVSVLALITGLLGGFFAG